MDESRKQFERFLREEHLYTDEELVWEGDRNCYSIYAVHIAWKSWQASRAAIEIKLPTENELHQKVCSGCASESLEMVEQAILADGLRIKE